MTIQTLRTRTDVFTDRDGREFALPVAGEHNYDDPLVRDLDNGRVLVSYMVNDNDSYDLDPSKEDCWGWEMVLLDSQRDADKLSERLNACDVCSTHPEWHTAEYDEGEPFDHEWVNADHQATIDGRAFFIEKYEHGQVRYALQGESSAVDRQWDVTGTAGWMISDGDWGADVDLEEMARNSLAEYTSWCNGDVWGVVHQEYEETEAGWETWGEYESCWGHIGSEYAESVLTEDHNNWEST